MRRRWYFIAPIGILAIALFTFVGGEAVKLLWNWLTPMLFGWRQITFWQAVGLLALSRILFGGLGIRGSHRSHFRRHMEERWANMTPEQREKFARGCRGFGPPPAPSQAAPTA